MTLTQRERDIARVEAQLKLRKLYEQYFKEDRGKRAERLNGIQNSQRQTGPNNRPV
jgi:hypothetical protein